MTPFHIENATLPGWVFGFLLLAFLFLAFVFLREPISAVRICLIGFFAALLAGLFAAYFIAGSVSFQAKGFQASGGLCTFFLVLWLFLRSAIGRLTPQKETNREAVGTGQPTAFVLASFVRRLVEQLEKLPLSKQPLRRMRLFLLLVCSITAVLLTSQIVFAFQSGLTVTEFPPYDEVGGVDSHAFVAGEAKGNDCKSLRVVVYAFTTRFYVQPETGPVALTQLGPGSTWRTCKWATWTHTGTHYAILLVKKGYQPETTLSSIPLADSNVLSSIVVEGKKAEKGGSR